MPLRPTALTNRYRQKTRCRALTDASGHVRSYQTRSLPTITRAGQLARRQNSHAWKTPAPACTLRHVGHTQTVHVLLQPIHDTISYGQGVIKPLFCVLEDELLSASDELHRETGQPHHVVRSHNELNVAKVASCVSMFLRSANCRYLIYSEADFEVFRPARATRCTDGG